jgi:hypothetical protein
VGISISNSEEQIAAIEGYYTDYNDFGCLRGDRIIIFDTMGSIIDSIIPNLPVVVDVEFDLSDAGLFYMAYWDTASSFAFYYYSFSLQTDSLVLSVLEPHFFCINDLDEIIFSDSISYPHFWNDTLLFLNKYRSDFFHISEQAEMLLFDQHGNSSFNLNARPYLYGGLGYPYFSPDRKKIIFTATKIVSFGECQPMALNEELWIYNLKY